MRLIHLALTRIACLAPGPELRSQTLQPLRHCRQAGTDSSSGAVQTPHGFPLNYLFKCKKILKVHQIWNKGQAIIRCANTLGVVKWYPSRLFTAKKKKKMLLCPWNFPGKNTGVGCHFLLQGIFSPRDWACTSCISCSAGNLYHWCHLGSRIYIHMYTHVWMYVCVCMVGNHCISAYATRSSFVSG